MSSTPSTLVWCIAMTRSWVRSERARVTTWGEGGGEGGVGGGRGGGREESN